MDRHVALLALVTVISAKAQWLNYPGKTTPRTADGKPDLSAPAPRAGDLPDLSGVWRTLPSSAAQLSRVLGPNSDALDSAGSQAGFLNQYFLNILADFKPGEAPMRPAAIKTLRERWNGPADGFPPTRCLPAGIPVADLFGAPFRIIQTPELIAILYEEKGLPREVFMDGRPLPRNPQPTWMGYSVGRWQSGALLVESAGFNDKTWLDSFGHPHGEQMHVTERFYRRDFGHMDIDITIDDPENYTGPFTIRSSQVLMPDTDLIETVCNENERDRAHFAK